MISRKARPRIKRLRLRPSYQEASVEVLQAQWEGSSPETRAAATRRLSDQLSNRGRSYNGVQVLVALLAAGEVALAALAIDKGMLTMHSSLMKCAAILYLVGLGVLVISILPPWSEIRPKYLKDPGEEALGGGPFGHYMELSRRSAHQRYVLWRARFWFVVAAMLTLVALILTACATGFFKM